MLLRLARKRVPICEISNWGFTMGIENNLIASACWMLSGPGSSSVAGQSPQPQLACCVLLVNLKAKVISGTSFSLVVFLVIKKKKERDFIYT